MLCNLFHLNDLAEVLHNFRRLTNSKSTFLIGAKKEASSKENWQEIGYFTAISLLMLFPHGSTFAKEVSYE